jgi:hypothetical protein
MTRQQQPRQARPGSGRWSRLRSGLTPEEINILQVACQ